MIARPALELLYSLFDKGSRNRWSYDSLKNFRQISPAVQSHLQQVYHTLVYALVASAVGTYLHILLNIGGIRTTLAGIGSTVWLMVTPPYEERKRFYLLMGAALLEGASFGPLIGLAIKIDPIVLVSAFVGTAVSFCCLSGAAMLARRGEYLYLGGLLSFGISMLLCLQFASSIFGDSTARIKFELYFGLLIFVGYTLFDTQEIIERAYLRDMDYTKHALTLFTDFIGLFLRVLVIMLKNSLEKNEKKMRRD